ncbi:acyltransferase [Neptunomonas phycophila]|uniref:acyltransferase family protein n=1 Tax=Neptunomonas phycophila TaxID=1572645 RepID=UPI0030F9C555
MKRLALLDYARFFAALSVVIYHYTFNGIVNGKIGSITYNLDLIEITKYGYLGVEFFFMISGYVIFFSAKKRTASEFAGSRAVRLFPAYWFAVLFTSFFVFFWGGDSITVSLKQTVVNLTMVQTLFGIENVDGVYWTLLYEIIFYFATFLLLFFGQQKNLGIIFLCWPILFCLTYLLGFDKFPLLGGYYYFFSAGAIFAIMAEKFQYRALLGLIVLLILCVDFSTDKVDYLFETKGVNYSAPVITIVVVSFFILFFYQNSSNGRSLSLPMSSLLGGVTYPIYLIHAYFGYIIIDNIATESNKFMVYIFTLVIVMIIALFMNLFVEQYFNKFWKRFFFYTLTCPLSLLEKRFSTKE